MQPWSRLLFDDEVAVTVHKILSHVFVIVVVQEEDEDENDDVDDDVDDDGSDDGADDVEDDGSDETLEGCSLLRLFNSSPRSFKVSVRRSICGIGGSILSTTSARFPRTSSAQLTRSAIRLKVSRIPEIRLLFFNVLLLHSGLGGGLISNLLKIPSKISRSFFTVSM